ncbi:MAG: Dyp-type peroxidase [Rhodococcus sp.]|nr:Dyp-type peroxidase [Rhodococcus sp. (in: high G+C Gram-positive bacteria)]
MPEPVQPQPVVTGLTTAALFLVLTIDEGGEDAARDLLADVSTIERVVDFRAVGIGVNVVAGIGSQAWDRLFAGERPAHLHVLEELHGDKHHMPSTPGDLLFHIRGAQQNVCFEVARQIMNQLDGAATVVDEVYGFQSFGHRNLLGFMDGTENPTGIEAFGAALVGEDEPDFTGGSYVIVQKYRHDMKAWDDISTEEQERVMGRSKIDDIEMSDDVKPANSHIALNDIEDENGEGLDILRANMPFGSFKDGEMGTYFIGYAADPAVTEQMLENMFIGDPPGNYDRLLDFSTAITGGLFFAPSKDFLDDLPPAPEQPEETDDDMQAPPVKAGSLAIGSLKRSVLR